jgi:hypothetical protein
MTEHRPTSNVGPPPGAIAQPAGDDGALEPIRRAMAEAELLRARIQELQRDGICDCPALEPGWA